MADREVHGTVPRGERHGSNTRPERRPRGEGNGLARLTEAEVLEIRARAAAGEAKKRLARVFGTTAQTIRNIVFRRTWGHI